MARTIGAPSRILKYSSVVMTRRRQAPRSSMVRYTVLGARRQSYDIWEDVKFPRELGDDVPD